MDSGLLQLWLPVKLRFECFSGAHADLAACVARVERFKRGDLIDSRVPRVLLQGFMLSVGTVGSFNRQFVDVVVAVEFLGFSFLDQNPLPSKAMCCSPSLVASLDIERLAEAMENQPPLASAVMAALTDTLRRRERLIFSLSKLDALQRVAVLVCEVWDRLREINMAHNQRMPFPLTQTELGDLLGMTPVHVNRTFATLPTRRLATFRDKTVEKHDIEALRRTYGGTTEADVVGW